MADLGFSSSDSEDEPEVPETTTQVPAPAKKIDVRSFIDDAAEDDDEDGNDELEAGEENEDYVKVRALKYNAWI